MRPCDCGKYTLQDSGGCRRISAHHHIHRDGVKNFAADSVDLAEDGIVGLFQCDFHMTRFFLTASNQHMASLHKEKVDLLLYSRIDHHIRPIAIWAGESWCCSEQTANQRAFRIDLASTVSKVRTAHVGKCGLMIRDAFDGKPCHLFGRGSHWPTAIVTSGLALERWNVLSEKSDFTAVACHDLALYFVSLNLPLLAHIQTLRRYKCVRSMAGYANALLAHVAANFVGMILVCSIQTME